MKKDVALITGASRGIGLAAARQLAKDGYRVGIISTGPQERYPDAVAALKADGAEFYWFSGDLGSSADRARIAREAVQTLGEIRILVNNAGVAPKTRTDLLEMTEESYDRVLGVNTKGSMFFTQLIAKHMIGLSMEGRVKRGTIVNVSSCSADVVSLNRGEYCVSKAGVSMLTKLYAARLAPEGILVHEVRRHCHRHDHHRAGKVRQAHCAGGVSHCAVGHGRGRGKRGLPAVQRSTGVYHGQLSGCGRRFPHSCPVICRAKRGEEQQKGG